MAPLRSQIFDELKRKQSTYKMSYWYGARSLREMFYTEEFDELAASTTTSNGTSRCPTRCRKTTSKATSASFTRSSTTTT